MCSSIDADVLRSLPREAQLLAKGLQGQLENLSLNVAVGVGLTTLSAAVGPVPVVTSFGDPVAPSFQMFVTAEDPLVSHVINAIVASLRSFQRASFAQSRLLDVSEVDARIAQVRREYTQWQVSERIPDPEHERAFRRRIAEQRSKLPKLIMEESPVPGCIESLLRRSPDESVFLLSADSARTERMISYWLSPNGAEELRLLQGSQLRTTTAIFAHPHVIGLLVGSRAMLEMIRGGEALLPFCLFDASSSQLRINQPPDENIMAQWERLIHELLQTRFAADRSPLKLSPAAWQWFADALNEVAIQPAQPGTRQRIEREAPGAVASLAGLLHAANGRGTAAISLETMQDAAKISSWLRRQSLLTLDRRYDSALETFIRASVVRSPDSTLTMKEIKQAFATHCNQNGLTLNHEPKREEVAAAMKRVCDASMRKDLKPPLPDTRGWTGFSLRTGSVLHEEPKVTLRIN